MKTKQNITAVMTTVVAIATLTSASAQSAEMPIDPIGGQLCKRQSKNAVSPEIRRSRFDVWTRCCSTPRAAGTAL